MPAPDYADEYAAARASVRSLLADADDDMAHLVVPSCPAWTVHDLCAHLVGVLLLPASDDLLVPGDELQQPADGLLQPVSRTR